ncbi:MMPL family transporter [Fulvivirga sp. M361]|nr:MMPL family transporter [Fulvivirga sp. M361]
MIRYRWMVILLAVVSVMGLAAGAANLGFDSDYRVFFKKDNPQLMAYEALQKKYTQDDNVLLVIEPADNEVFNAKTLEAIEQLTENSWQVPYSSRVDAITNFQHTYAEGDDLFVEDLVEGANGKTASEIQKIEAIAKREPLLVHRLLNEKGTVAAVNITVKLPGESITENPEVISFVRQMSEDFQKANPALKVHLSGIVMLNGAFFEASEKDSSTLIPLMFLVILITIFISTRTLSGTFVSLLVIVFSIVAGMGFAGYMGIKLTPPSGAAPIIIMTLAVADSIHILITMMHGMRTGMSKREAIVESLRVNFMPVFITSLTTVIGFLSMNTAEVPPFRDLGNITAVGMTMAFILSVTLLPAVMAVLPVRVKVKDQEKSKSGRFYDVLANFVIGQKKPVLVGSVLMISLLSYFAVNIELNDEFVKYFDDRISFRKDTDFINENLTGIYNAEFSIGSGESGGINNPDYLKNLEKFERWLEEQPEIVHVNAYSEVARRVNRSMHGDDPAFYKIPENREEAAQYLLLYELSLPFGLDLNNQINVDKSESRLTATMVNMPTTSMIRFAKRAETWLVENTPEYMHTNGISPTMMFAYLSRTQVLSLITGTAIALALISLILIGALKSIKFGMISILPNVTPAFAGFGIWALSGGQINLGISIVFGMTLGIIVDDTIHFLSKYLRAIRDHGYTPEEAVRYAFNTVGRALVVTTIVLVAGFVILAQSSFGMNSGMAMVTSIIIVCALAIDFLLLPAMLLLIGKKKVATT